MRLDVVREANSSEDVPLNKQLADVYFFSLSADL